MKLGTWTHIYFVEQPRGTHAFWNDMIGQKVSVTDFIFKAWVFMEFLLTPKIKSTPALTTLTPFLLALQIFLSLFVTSSQTLDVRKDVHENFSEAKSVHLFHNTLFSLVFLMWLPYLVATENLYALLYSFSFSSAFCNSSFFFCFVLFCFVFNVYHWVHLLMYNGCSHLSAFLKCFSSHCSVTHTYCTTQNYMD